jgi:hypothetical protein
MTNPPLGPATAARALASAWQLLAITLPGAWAREIGGALAVVTRAPIATLNGVWVIDDGTTTADIETGLDAVASTGLPHCVQLRPGSHDVLSAVPAQRGLIAEASVPLMATAGPLRFRPLENLALRRLAPEEAPLHCEIAAEAFGAPVEVFTALVNPALLARPELRGYLGEVGGEPVVTAIGIVAGGAVGIFNVATIPSHQRRGYGTASTALAFADGMKAGASWGWLQSSESGYGIYRRLGFETLEWWDCWVTSP